MREVRALFGFVIGGLFGLYAVTYAWMGIEKLTQPDYDPGWDYAGGLVGVCGGIVGAVLGFVLGWRGTKKMRDRD